MTFEELAQRLQSDAQAASIDAALVDGALSALDAAFSASEKVFERRWAICDQIGAASELAWRAVLVRARDEYEARTIANTAREIESAFAQSAEDGWGAWLRAVADAVLAFRPRYTRGLCAPIFPFEGSHRAAAADIRRAVGRMAESRWDEVADEVAFMAEQDLLPASTRARLITMCAQIEMWRFSEMQRARQLLDRAMRLSPKDSWIVSTMGDYHLKSNDLSRAEDCYQNAIAIAPTESEGYAGFGRRYEDVQEYDKAEDWYRQAISRAGGDATGYDRLLRLLARTDFRRYAAEISDLIDRRNAVDPEGEYDAYLAIGDGCKDAGLPEKARYWYEKASSGRPSWPLAYVSLAELSEGLDDTAKALSLCRRAIELAPEYPLSYFLAGRLYEAQRRWPEVLRLYETFPDRPRRWKRYARVSVARMRAELGDRDAAQREMMEVLNEETDSNLEQIYARAAIENLAEDCYRKHDDASTALELFDKVLKASGSSYRARYSNLVGNLYYYHGEYDRAAGYYRSASTDEPGSALYHRYISDAYRSMGDFEEARREIHAAFELDHDRRRHDEDLATLENTQGNRAYKRSDFRKAIDHYKRAVELVPSMEVYCTNLAQAWELLKESGSRIAQLREAQHWYGEAQKIRGAPNQARRIEALSRQQELAAEYGEQALDWIPIVSPIIVEVATGLEPHVSGPAADTISDTISKEMERALTRMRDGISGDLGITVPGVRVRSQEELPLGTYVISLMEIPLVSGTVPPGRRYYTGSEQLLTKQGIKAEPAADPVSGTPGFWVASADAERVGAAEGELWKTVAEFMARHVEAVVRRNAAEFVGHQEIMNLLEGTPKDLREAIVGSRKAVSALTNVCRGLAAENVPVQPIDELCATFKELYDRGVDPAEIVERVRAQPSFLRQLPGHEKGERYVRCSEGFEAEIRRSLYSCAKREVLAMDPSRCQAAIAAVNAATRDTGSVLVVTDPPLRAFVRRLVEFEAPDAPVLSVSETRHDTEYSPERVEFDVLPPLAETGGTRHTAGSAAERSDPAPGDEAAWASARGIEVVVSRDFLACRSPADESSLEETLALMRDGLFYELGILVPQVEVRTDDALDATGFRIRIDTLTPVSSTGLKANEFLANDTVERLRLLGLQGREAANPANGNACTILSGDGGQVQTCRDAGLTIWGPGGYVVLELSKQIRKGAPALQHDKATRHLLDALARSFPDLVELTLQRFRLPMLGQVLRHLLAEEISIRDLRSVVDALLALQGTTDVDLDRFIVFGSSAEPLCPDPKGRPVAELPPSQLADHVRTCLKRTISHKYSRGSNTLVVYLLSPTIEQWLREASGGQPDDAMAERFIAAVRKELPERPRPMTAALLTNFDIRGIAWQILRGSFPELPVLCYQELVPELNIQPVARIDWN